MSFSWQSIDVDQEGMYLDHGKDDADGTTDSLGRRGAEDILGDVQGIDGHVQRGDDVVPAFRSLGI